MNTEEEEEEEGNEVWVSKKWIREKERKKDKMGNRGMIKGFIT